MEHALTWWNSITLEDKVFNISEWLKSKGIDSKERRGDILQDSDIYEVYNLIILNRHNV